MKPFLKNLAVLAGLTLPGGLVWGVPCDGVTTCERPDFNVGTQSGWSVSASGVSSIKALVSIVPSSGNQIGSQYYFGASNSDLGATLANTLFTPGGSGARVISAAFATNASQIPTATVSGGSVQQLLGATGYFFYAQACPSGSGIYNSSGCSAWTQIGNTTTSNYPASVFAALVKPTDATTNSISARTNVPVADLGNVSLVDLRVEDQITPANSMTLSPIGFGGVNTIITINNSLFTNGFNPNNKYQYKGDVKYPYNIAVPSSLGQTVGSFWTTPVNPGPVTVSNVTHCSMQVTAQNSNGVPPNPGYTEYSLCAGGNCVTSGQIGASPSVSATISGLTFNTAYVPGAKALVGNQDGSQAGWNSSGQTTAASTKTLDWGSLNPLSISARTTGAATLNIAGVTMSPSDTWSITLAGGPGAATPPSGTGTPPATIALSGLNANTHYTVQIHLVDASGVSCTNDLPAAPLGFYTLPAAPTAGNLGSPTSRTLPVNWTDGSTNPNPATTYHLQYSSNGGTTWTDFATNPAKTAGPAQSGTITGLLPEVTYSVQVKTVAQSGVPVDDSAYFPLPGTATTLNEAPTIASMNCAAPTGSNSTCTAQASDTSGLLTDLFCHWTINNSGVITAGNDSLANSSGNCPQISVSMPANGLYNVTLVVTDHQNIGVNKLSSTPSTRQINLGATPNSIDPITAQNGTTIVVGFPATFSTVVRDMFNGIINGQGVNWTVTAGVTLDPAHVNNSTFTIVTGFDSLHNPVTLTAAWPGLTSQTISLTVNPSGLQFPGATTVTLIPNPLGVTTANLHCSAYDNSPGSGTITYAWSMEQGPSPLKSLVPTGTDGDAVSTFSAALGPYQFRCTVKDNLGSNFALTNSTTIAQVVNGISVSPNNVTLQTLQNQVFTAAAMDQFQLSMPTPSNLQWNTTGGGSVSGAGAHASFNSPIIGQEVTVTAKDPVTGKSGAATVNVISFDVSAAYAYPVPYKASQGSGVIHFAGLGSQSSLHIYTTSGRRVFDITLASPTYDWPIVNSSGENVASGVYFYVIQSPEGKKDGKLIIIK